MPEQYGNFTIPDEAGGYGGAIAGIMGALSKKMRQRRQKEIDDDLKRRDQLAERFAAIEKDPSYDAEARNKARDAYNRLIMLMPDEKTPKEYLPGKNGELPPALEAVVRRKIMKEGPQPPQQPAEIQNPNIPQPTPQQGAAGSAGAAEVAGGASTLPPMPPAMPPSRMTGLDLPEMMDAPAMASSAAAVPPVPGGVQPAPGKISPAPAIGGMPPPAMPAMPPMPGGYEEIIETRRGPLDMAREEAEIAKIKNGIPDEVADAIGLPRGTDIRVAQEMRLREQQAAKQRIEEAKVEARAALDRAKTLRELALIETDQTKAAALMKNAEAHMLSAEASMERAMNPQHSERSMLGFPITRVDEKGNLVDVVYTKPGAMGGQPIVVPIPPIGGSDERGRKTQVGEGERQSVANMEDMLDREIPELRRLADAHKDWLGPMVGRLMKAGTNWSDDLPPDMYKLVVASANLTMERIYELSGKQINESEAKRLADVLTNPAVPYPKWIAALNELEAKLRALRKGKSVPQRNGQPAAGTPGAAGGALKSPKEIPVAERVVGKTRAMLNGAEVIWTGAGWQPAVGGE